VRILIQTSESVVTVEAEAPTCLTSPTISAQATLTYTTHTRTHTRPHTPTTCLILLLHHIVFRLGSPPLLFLVMRFFNEALGVDQGGLDSCAPYADNVFGPFVDPSCRDGYDFTLMFEQCVLCAVPLLLLLLLLPIRVYSLSGENVKTGPNYMRAAKVVSAECISCCAYLPCRSLGNLPVLRLLQRCLQCFNW
jgi:hypothetical protein